MIEGCTNGNILCDTELPFVNRGDSITHFTKNTIYFFSVYHKVLLLFAL
jgi:hypothetical protein